jgi:hypothetical protein
MKLKDRLKQWIQDERNLAVAKSVDTSVLNGRYAILYELEEWLKNQITHCEEKK